MRETSCNINITYKINTYYKIRTNKFGHSIGLNSTLWRPQGIRNLGVSLAKYLLICFKFYESTILINKLFYMKQTLTIINVIILIKIFCYYKWGSSNFKEEELQRKNITSEKVFLI